METCSSDDWTLDIGVGEAWAYFRRCRSVEKFVGGIWGNSWDELSGGPKRKVRNTRIPRLTWATRLPSCGLGCTIRDVE